MARCFNGHYMAPGETYCKKCTKNQDSGSNESSFGGTVFGIIFIVFIIIALGA